MNTLQYTNDNGDILAIGVFFGNGAATIAEIKAGTPLQNVVQTVDRGNGNVETKILVERYFLWSAKEYLTNVANSYPTRYTNRGNVCTLVELTERCAKFTYTNVDRGNAIVYVEIMPIE